MYRKINELMLSAAKLTIPQINHSPYKKHTGNPWWNTNCENARSNKWNLYKKYLKDPTPDNLTAAKQAKNLSNRIINQTKQIYWDNHISNSDNISSM